MQSARQLWPITVCLLLGCAYLVASTIVLSSDSWDSSPPKKGITIRIEKSVRKSRSAGDHWASNPWANPWANPWESSWSSGSGGHLTKEITISKSWPPAEGWPKKSSWPSWPSDGWKSGKEISISIGASGADSWEPQSWAASSRSSWSNPWGGWNSWDPWKNSRVKIKPEAQEVHSGDALIREHRNSNQGINGYVQFLQYVRPKPKQCGHCGWPTK